YYTYRVEIGGKANEACDPYARTTGLNGKRAMVIDLSSTNPEGWEQDSDPNAGKNYTDAVIYELHVRDLSTSSDSGITNKGKFLGLTETGTKSPSGVATGLDHIKELGVTHVHLLPVYDFGSVDEGNIYAEQFNWGYDPVNYNVPEGSYSTDPSRGEVRVKEMKQMVQALHQNGISVIMDVVYNHVQSAGDFCFNQIVPNYFTRISEDGTYSNGSGCGNDTATERSMVRKYIVDSVKYWADEYHIDGFRFDLVGLLGTDVVNEIVEEVHKDHPNVIFYGEGWTMNTNVTKPSYTLATQVNSTQTPGFAYFSDTIRDLLKGSVFNQETGFVSGASGLEATLEKCFMGLSPDWCTTPSQSVNYASCHDNMTLIDRITVSTPNASRADQIKMNNLAAAIYMTSEGIPFMQAGEEMLRTKVKSDGSFDSNSYSSGDKINQLRWEDLANDEYKQVFEYYKGLIAFRKAHGALRLTDAASVRSNVIPAKGMSSNVVAFRINGGVNGETAEALYVIFNANNEAVEVELPEGKWNVYINGEKAGTEVLQTIKDGKVSVDGISAMVLAQDGNSADDSGSGSSSSSVLLIVVIVAVVVVAAAAGFVIVGKGKKNGKNTK
ncbi:MAG: type I pullulanase, partial [Lachnospiraceae bacterium]|nr:type I pullulanase [Lachnospiraceae bacterium]